MALLLLLRMWIYEPTVDGLGIFGIALRTYTGSLCILHRFHARLTVGIGTNNM